MIRYNEKENWQCILQRECRNTYLLNVLTYLLHLLTKLTYILTKLTYLLNILTTPTY